MLCYTDKDILHGTSQVEDPAHKRIFCTVVQVWQHITL